MRARDAGLGRQLQQEQQARQREAHQLDMVLRQMQAEQNRERDAEARAQRVEDAQARNLALTQEAKRLDMERMLAQEKLHKEQALTEHYNRMDEAAFDAAARLEREEEITKRHHGKERIRNRRPRGGTRAPKKSPAGDAPAASSELDVDPNTVTDTQLAIINAKRRRAGLPRLER